MKGDVVDVEEMKVMFVGKIHRRAFKGKVKY